MFAVVGILDFMCPSWSFLLHCLLLWPHSAGRNLSRVFNLTEGSGPSSHLCFSHLLPGSSLPAKWLWGSGCLPTTHRCPQPFLPACSLPVLCTDPTCGNSSSVLFTVIYVSLCSSLWLLPFQIEKFFFFIIQIIRAHWEKLLTVPKSTVLTKDICQCISAYLLFWEHFSTPNDHAHNVWDTRSSSPCCCVTSVFLARLFLSITDDAFYYLVPFWWRGLKTVDWLLT